MNEKIFKKFGDAQDCPVRNVLDRIGDKWSMLVMLVLAEEEVMRFTEIHKYIESISQKMLVVTLKSLEADGLVKRTVFPQIPPRVDYELTPRARTLLPYLRGLVSWAKENMSDIRHSRAVFEERA